MVGTLTHWTAVGTVPCGTHVTTKSMKTFDTKSPESIRALLFGADKMADKPLYVSTGSTQLNLACTGRTKDGFRAGTYTLFVGDSSSGKTFLCLTCLAEASVNPEFDAYQLIYDAAENGAMMDFKRFFGEKMAERVMPPAGTKEDPAFSTNVEDFYDNLDEALARGPCIYICDSMDALTTNEEEEKLEQQKKARRGGKEATGTYGTSKPKINSQRLRMAISKIEKTGSILIIITQTRDNIGFGAMFTPKTRGGGHALKFYAHLEIWTSRKGSIKSKSKIKGKIRQLGIKSLCKVKKNRHNGVEADALVPIYHSYGIDDIGSCIEYLLEEGYWKKVKGKVNAPEIAGGQKLNEEELAKYVDQKGLKKKLRAIVGRHWKIVAESCKLDRSNPYV